MRTLLMIILICMLTPIQEKKPSSDIKKEQKMGENEIKRQRVLSLLDQSLNSLGDFKNEQLKISVKARIASLLWVTDEARARRIFSEALQDTYTIKDQGPQLPYSLGEAFEAMSAPAFRLRREILQLAAKHSFEFAENMRKSIKESAEVETDTPPKPNQVEQSSQSLQMAVALAKDNPDQAYKIVKGALNGGVTLAFLSALGGIRHENQPLANELFKEAMRVARDTADILYLTFYLMPDPDSLALNKPPANDLDRVAMIKSFLVVAHQVLNKQVDISPTPAMRASRDVQNESFRELLNLYNAFAPDMSPTIRTLITKLGTNLTTKEPEDYRALLTRADSINNPQVRDGLYARAAMLASREDDFDKAIDIARKINNSQSRLTITSVLYFQAVLKALGKEDGETALKYTKEIEFLPQRVEAVNRTSQFFHGKKDTARAVDTLMSLVEWLEKVKTSSEKAYAMLVVAGALAKLDTARSFVVLEAAITAINDVDFSPKSQRPIEAFQPIPVTIERLDLKPSFSVLATADLERSIALARSLKMPELSVLAQLVICQAILNKPLQTKPNK